MLATVALVTAILANPVPSLTPQLVNAATEHGITPSRIEAPGPQGP